MAIKNHKMYGVWTNLSVNQPIGERELEQNSFRQRITYIMGEMGAEAIAMDPKVNNERAIKCYEKVDLKSKDFKGT